MRRLTNLVLLLISLATTGCAADTRPMIDYRPCGAAALVTCGKAGVYTLYPYNSQRIESTTVQLGEPVGFVRGIGTLLAVAGNDHSH